MNRVIYYYQTFVGLEDVLSLDSCPVTHILVSSIHFGKNTDGTPYIHLNDYPPEHSKFNQLWKDIKIANGKGIKIMFMLGGAGGAYEDLFSNFEVYYKFLHDTIKLHPEIAGIDLDIEEFVEIEMVKKLINRLDQDFGKDFLISMAPLSGSLSTDFPGMGGFSYKELINSNEGKRINWFNGQFYGTFSEHEFDSIVKNGYVANKVVMGMLSGEYDPESFKIALETIKNVSNKYPDMGGVFSWEYFDCPPDTDNHALWAVNVSKCMQKTSINRCLIS